MKTIPNQKQIDAEPLLVPAKTIARVLSCTPRYVHLLAESGEIPHHRFGKACIRFSLPAVLAALGVNQRGGGIMSHSHEPLPVELLATSDERREKFPNSARAKCIKSITASIGEGGFREFLRQPQPAFQYMLGAYLLEHHAEELLERLERLEAQQTGGIDNQ